MAILDDVINLGNSRAINGLSNLAQLADFSTDLIDLSNGRQLEEILKEFRFQNNNHLAILIRYCERIIVENEYRRKLDERLLENQEKIISLLEGRT